MPESEPKPKLIELLAPGAGQGWIAVLKNGKADVVHEIPAPAAAADQRATPQGALGPAVRLRGMPASAAFGVDPAGAPAPPTIPPGLVVTMRSMARGAMGPAADRAQGALREMASALLAPDRATASQAELALRAGGREMPAITPFLPKETFPPAAAPPQAPQPDQTP